MNSDSIMKSDILDIIFENRNKAYGAYTLRKFYTNRLVFALSATLFCMIVLSAFSFVSNDERVADKLGFVLSTVTGSILKEDESKPIPKQKIKTSPVVSQQKFTSKPIIVKKDDPADKLPDDLTKNNIGGNTIVGKPLGDVIGNIVTDSSDAGIFTELPKPIVDVNEPIAKAEDDPQFPGGLKSLREFLKRHLVNPAEMEEGEEVAVKIQFVVGNDGNLKSFEVIESGGEEFNQEVIRVLKKMPQWTPGKVKGKNVSVYTTIPVKFVGW